MLESLPSYPMTESPAPTWSFAQVDLSSPLLTTDVRTPYYYPAFIISYVDFIIFWNFKLKKLLLDSVL